MSNYFFDLPNELQIIIYHYDSTYLELFEKVLDELSPIRLYQMLLSGTYFIVNLKSNLYCTCDCLDEPTWVRVCHYKNLDFLTELFTNNQIVSITNQQRQYFENLFF